MNFGFFKKYKTGIVLSGGAVRGFAHLGVLKALQESKIYPDIISGVSAGSIVGAFYADGYEPEEILDIFERKNFFEMVGLVFKNKGLLNINGLKKLLENNLRSKNFEDLKKPLIVTATNLKTGKAEHFNKGNLVEKILASSSIPILFKPQKMNGGIYVDGGLVNNLPLKPIEKKCKNLIGVNVNPLEKNPDLNGIKNIAIHAFHVNIANTVYYKRDMFDIYIEPKKLKNFGYFNIKESSEIFTIGYEAAKKEIS